MQKTKQVQNKKQKVAAKSGKSTDKLSKSFKEQIILLIEKTNKSAHKSLAKLEKQFLVLSGKGPKVKTKAPVRPKKKGTPKKLKPQDA